MSTVLTRGSNGVSYGYRHTLTSDEVTEREVIVDFQVSLPLVASVDLVDILDAVRAQTDMSISYPEDGQIKIADNALIEAMLLANELKALINAHFIDAVSHVTAIDEANTITSADATDFATLLTLGDDILNSYDVHDDDAELASSWVYHAAQETGDHSPSDVTALTTIAEVTTQLNDLKAKYDGHDADATTHDGAASVNQSTEADIGSSFAFAEGDKISVIAQYARGDV